MLAAAAFTHVLIHIAGLCTQRTNSDRKWRADGIQLLCRCLADSLDRAFEERADATMDSITQKPPLGNVTAWELLCPAGLSHGLQVGTVTFCFMPTIILSTGRLNRPLKWRAHLQPTFHCWSLLQSWKVHMYMHVGRFQCMFCNRAVQHRRHVQTFCCCPDSTC